MFGPYNLFATSGSPAGDLEGLLLPGVEGHPEKDHDFLVERSPSTHLSALTCPLLVIQGRNDPRVKAVESEDVVNQLARPGQAGGESSSLKTKGTTSSNTRTKCCYSGITHFFVEHLRLRSPPKHCNAADLQRPEAA